MSDSYSRLPGMREWHQTIAIYKIHVILSRLIIGSMAKPRLVHQSFENLPLRQTSFIDIALQTPPSSPPSITSLHLRYLAHQISHHASSKPWFRPPSRSSLEASGPPNRSSTTSATETDVHQRRSSTAARSSSSGAISAIRRFRTFRPDGQHCSVSVAIATSSSSQTIH